jgi:hypothetical protein
MHEKLEFLAIHASSKAAVTTHGNAQALPTTKNLSSVKRTGCGSESQSSGEAGKSLGNVDRGSPRFTLVIEMPSRRPLTGSMGLS